MRGEKKFLFKRRMKLFVVSSIVLLGLSVILWFFASTEIMIIDVPVEETKQGSLKESKIPLKDTINDRPKKLPNNHDSNSTPSLPNGQSNSNLNPQPEINSQNSNSIPSESPEKIAESTPSNSQFEESQPETTKPIKIKNYKTFNLVLRNETKSPDGFIRNIYTINNQFPGPEIIVDKGDTVRINITNYIGRSTTIHVHGMIHKETVYMDGVPYVTQCPIQNGSSFIYEFEATHPGTYWYYSHYETQRADGLYGSLIVKDPDESRYYNYDDEKTIFLSDWYHDESSILLKNYRYNNNTSIFEPIPNSGLINGKGIFNCMDDPIKKENCNFESLSVEEFYIEPNKKNRLRIINTSAMTSFFLSIDEHMLQVIEVDGVPTTPSSKFHRLPIHVGQRYSIIPIRLPQYTSTLNFYLRAEFAKKSFRSTSPYSTSNLFPTELRAIIRYSKKENDKSLPSTLSWTLQQSSLMFPLIDLNPLDLKSYSQEILPENTTYYEFDFIIEKINEQKTLNFNHKGFNDDIELFYGSINSVHRGVSIYNPDKRTNTLKLLLEGKIKFFPFYLNIYVFKRKLTIDLLLKNNDDLDQVFYLHGHKFWVLGQGTNSTPIHSDLNYFNPIKRDTVTVPSSGWTLIKFTLDNPGIWTFSNPIVWHQNIGMIGQIIELPKKLKNFSIPPIEWCKLCNDKSDKNNFKVCQRNDDSGLMDAIKNIWNNN
ncbi:Fet3p [Rhizophagus irregularis DAOM 197198w]|uniref:Fet3p n=3 Tax=Rhizophagus irregularis TaxID=588596 RepID=A0A015M319_RHIIW|nr:Fet3p [Rhizophagus irregularis DAOM 197198w]